MKPDQQRTDKAAAPEVVRAVRACGEPCEDPKRWQAYVSVKPKNVMRNVDTKLATGEYGDVKRYCHVQERSEGVRDNDGSLIVDLSSRS